MDEKQAKDVFDSIQECLRSLNAMLVDAERSISNAEFSKLRLTTAKAMASIIDICEFHVYADHPYLRPYADDKDPD